MDANNVASKLRVSLRLAVVVSVEFSNSELFKYSKSAIKLESIVGVVGG